MFSTRHISTSEEWREEQEGREGGGVCAYQEAFMLIMHLMEEIRGRGKDERRKCVFRETRQGWEELDEFGGVRSSGEAGIRFGCPSV